MKRISFRQFSLQQKILFCSSALVLITSIIFFVLDFIFVGTTISYKDKSYLILIFNLSSVVLAILSFFFYKPLEIFVPILLSCGFGQLLYQSCFPWADIATNVPFFANSLDKARSISSFYISFLVIFGILLVTLIVSCFLKEREQAEEAK